MGKVANRHRELMRQLAVEGSLSVDKLVERLGVGEATIRRDLQWLASSRRVVRTYGGAALPGAPVLATTAETRAKVGIALRAASQIKDGETVVITGGSTTLALSRVLLLERRQLTVVTNALDVAQVLLDREGIDLIVLGGMVRPRMHSLLGHLTELCARELRAHRLFMGAKAIRPGHGLMNDHVPEVLTDRALVRMVDKITVLADATKFMCTAPAFVFGIESVDQVITDPRLPQHVRMQLQAAGVEVLLSEPEGATE